MVDPGVVDQAEAAEHCARDRLSLAEHEPDLGKRLRLLTTAVEFALRSVSIGWGFPTSKPQRLWELFDDPIAALIPSDIRLLLDGLRPEPYGELMTAEQAVAVVETLFKLRDAGPRSTWSSPARSPVGWSELSPTERDVLHHALQSATAIVAHAELWLFGSRATGTAAEGSDYDLALVVPDDVPPPLRGIAMGEVWSAVHHHGARTDHHLVLASSFKNPTDEDRALVIEIKSYGLRVPSPDAPLPNASEV
jgi:hypothetical protein